MKEFNFLFSYFYNFQKIIFIIYILFINIIIWKKFILFNNNELNKNYEYILKTHNFIYHNNILNNKIRIGIYTYGLKNGGIQRISSLLIKYLNKVKIFKLYLFSHRNKEKNEYIIPKEIKRILIKKQKYKDLLKQLKKKKLIF